MVARLGLVVLAVLVLLVVAGKPVPWALDHSWPLAYPSGPHWERVSPISGQWVFVGD